MAAGDPLTPHQREKLENLLARGERSTEEEARDMYCGVYWHACQRGHIHVLDTFLPRLSRDGARVLVEQCNFHGHIVAAKYGRVDVLRHLEQYDAWIHCSFTLRKRNALLMFAAVVRNEPDVLRYIMNVRGAGRVTAAEGTMLCTLLAATKRGHLECLRILLDAQGDQRVDLAHPDCTALSVACGIADGARAVDAVKMLLGAREKDVVLAGADRAFVLAAAWNRTRLMDELLQLDGARRIDVHTSNASALMHACASGAPDAVRALLSLTGDRRIDTHVDSDAAFRAACESRHPRSLETVHALLTTDAPRLPRDATQLACVNDCAELARLQAHRAERCSLPAWVHPKLRRALRCV